MKTFIYTIANILLASLLFSPVYIYAQCPSSGPNITTTCGANTTLVADTTFTRYAMTRMQCTPYTISGTNAFPTTCDDCVTGQINIGFPFSFYGNTYTTAVIQSNGIVGFGPFSYTGYMPYSIPAAGNPDNYIAGFYADIDIRYGGTITYQTIGTAPNRKFVVSYNNVVPYNGGSAGTGTASFQIVLNEDNSFHVIISQISSNWYASTSENYGTSGAENSNGGVAFVVENRNYNTDMLGIVPGNRDCTHFNPQPCQFVGWYNNGVLVSTNGSYTVSPTTQQSYQPKWFCTPDSCLGTPVVVSIADRPKVDVTHCQYDVSQSLSATNNCGYSLSAPMLYSVGSVFNTGSFTSTDPQFARFSSGTSCSANSSTTYYYDVVSFVPSVSGTYVLDMCHVGSTFDGYAALYINNFNPTSICDIPANFIIGDDDGNSGTCSSQPRISASLIAGRTYYLVSTTYSTNTTGNYQWTYSSGPTGGSISVLNSVENPLNWYTSLTSTTPIGTGNSFNPVGVLGSGIANTNTPGTWTFYTSCGSSTACRTAVTYTITPASEAEITTTICTNAASQAITPSLSCSSTIPTVASGVIFNAATLTTSSPTVNNGTRNTATCALVAGNTHYYHVYRFRVTTAGSYTFNNCFNSVDAYAFLYSGGFNGANPCSNTFIIGNDDSSIRGCGNDPQLTATLSPGVDYYLVTTTYTSGVVGAFDWTYTTTSGGQLLDYSSTSVMNWYTSPTATTSIATGNTFNPVGATGSGLANTATAGTTYYYYKCMPTSACMNRAAYTITQGPTAFTSIIGPSSSICPNTEITLTATGGLTPAGTNIAWYTGANGTGVNIGTGASITVTPSANTTYYVRKENTCLNTADVNLPIQLKTFIYASDGTTSNTYCTDNDNWHHFFTGDNIIFSLKGDIAALGSAAVSINVNNTFYQAPNDPHVCTGVTPDETFEMARSWNLAYTGIPNPPYDVKFYHTPAEKAEVITAAADWMSMPIHSTCDYSYKYNPIASGWFWFKNELLPYSAASYDGTHLMSLGAATTANGINYETLTGITSFSGGSGGVILIPVILLDNSIVSFAGSYQPNIKANVLKWAMDTQEDIAYFELYHSKNAVQWQLLTTVDKHEALQYNYNHNNPTATVNYYYLKAYNYDASITNSQVVAINTPASNISYTVYPNPTTSVVKYETTLLNADKLQLELTNILGQKLLNTSYNLEAGVQSLTIDLASFASGTYLLTVLHEGTQVVHSIPIIKAQ